MSGVKATRRVLIGPAYLGSLRKIELVDIASGTSTHGLGELERILSGAHDAGDEVGFTLEAPEYDAYRGPFCPEGIELLVDERKAGREGAGGQGDGDGDQATN